MSSSAAPGYGVMEISPGKSASRRRKTGAFAENTVPGRVRLNPVSESMFLNRSQPRSAIFQRYCG